MADDKKLNIVIALKDQATKGIKSVTSALSNFVKAPIGKAAGLVSGLGKAIFSLPGLIAGAAITGLGKEIVDVTAKFEQWQVAFTTLTGSADTANKVLAQIKQFAASTPFELPGLVESSKQLLAFGFTTEELIPTMKSLGDIAAGVGTDKLPTLVSSLGKIRTKGRASLEELNMMLEAGVPILDQLAKNFDVSKEKLFDMVSKGEVGFEAVRQSLQDLSSEGGLFNDLMSKQTETLGGIFSNISDNMTQAALAIGNEMLPLLKDVATAIKDFTSTENLPKFIAAVKMFMVDIETNIKIGAEALKELLSEPFRLQTYKSIFDELVLGVSKIWGAIKNLGRGGLKALKEIIAEEKKDTRTYEEEVIQIRKDAADKKKKIEADLLQQTKNNSQEKLKIQNIEADREKVFATNSGQIEAVKATVAINQYKHRASQIKMMRDLSLEEEIAILQEELEAHTFQAGEIEKVELKLNELKSKLREQQDNEEEKARKKRQETIEKEYAHYSDLSKNFVLDSVNNFKERTEKEKEIEENYQKALSDLADKKFDSDAERQEALKKLNEEYAKKRKENEGNLLTDIGNALKKALSAQVDAIVAAEIAKATAAATAAAIPSFGASLLGLAGQVVAITGAGELAKGIINGVKFNQGGVIPGQSTIGDRNVVPMARFNGGELVSNRQQQTNLLHHMANNRGAQLPGSNAGSGGDMTIQMNVDGIKLGDVVVKNYNRARQLNQITKIQGF